MMGLDDRILVHPKFRRAVALAGSEAIHLWLGLRAYCSQQLTDGLVPEDMLQFVDGPIKPRARLNAISALRAVGLVHGPAERASCPDCKGAAPQESGLWLHDYLQHSESRERALQRRVNNRERQQKLRSMSQRDSACDNASDERVSTRHQAKPIQIQTKPDLPPTPLAGGAAAIADQRITRERLPCPKDLSLLPDQLGQLETSMITREFIAEATRKFIGQELADKEKTMTLVQWRKCLYAAVCNGWSQRKPPGMVKHEQAKREASQGAQTPAYKLLKPADGLAPLPIGETLAALDLARKAVGR